MCPCGSTLHLLLMNIRFWMSSGSQRSHLQVRCGSKKRSIQINTRDHSAPSQLLNIDSFISQSWIKHAHPNPHQGIDRNLKLIWVTWYLLTKVCKSINNCLFFHQNADLIWVVLFVVKHVFVPLIRPSVNTDECWRSLLTCDYSGRKCQHGVAAKASKRPRRQLSTPAHPRPASCLLCGILKLQQPKCFYNQVKKKRGGGITEDLHFRWLKD